MSHAVETMFSVMETPWHGLGRILQSAPTTASAALEEAGLNWTVRLEPVVVAGQETPWRGVVRSTDQRTLGIVSSDFHPVQNADAMKFFDRVVQNGDCTYESAGSLHDGKVVWVLAKVTEDIEVLPGDVVQRYVILSNSHNGSRAVRVRGTDVRVVCANTLAQSDVGLGGEFLYARHDGRAERKIAEAKSDFTSMIASLREDAVRYRALAKTGLWSVSLDQYVKACFAPLTARKADDDEEENIGVRLIEAALDAAKSAHAREQLPAIEGTWWAAFNGVTQVLTHGASGTLAGSAKTSSLWFGSAGKKVERAKRLAFKGAGVLV